MLSRVWVFVKKHHRKGILGCAVIGGGIYLAKYGLEKLQERRRTDVHEYFDGFRRGRHFDATQSTFRQSVAAAIENLKSIICIELDTQELTTLLKSNPSNKVEMWEELKVLAFTRVTVSIYACAVLVVLMCVQINVAGGRTYMGYVKPAAKEFLQETFADCVSYFVEKGVFELVENVKTAVKKVVGNLSLKEKLMLTHVEQIMGDVRKEVEKKGFDLCRYGFEGCSGVVEKGGGELRDILESDDCASVVYESVGMGFTHLSELLTDFYARSGKSESYAFVNPHEMRVPLAKLIPALSNLVSAQCSVQPKSLIEVLMQFGKIKAFGGNLYDSFSKN